MYSDHDEAIITALVGTSREREQPLSVLRLIADSVQRPLRDARYLLLEEGFARNVLEIKKDKSNLIRNNNKPVKLGQNFAGKAIEIPSTRLR